MNKIDATDLTIIYPVRIDSVERLENLLHSTNFLLKHLDVNIIIVEQSYYSNGILTKLLNPNINYEFVEDFDEIFYRTRIINTQVLKIKTPYIGIWDADIITPIDQILNGLEFLRAGTFEFIIPYKNLVYDIHRIIKKNIL